MLNKFLVEGRLTADPEIKTIGENRLCKFTIACERPKRKGEETAETDFFPCTAWNRNADVIVDWFGKDDMVTLVGSVRNNRYEKDGQKRSAIEVKVEEIHFSGGKKEAGKTPHRPTTATITPTQEHRTIRCSEPKNHRRIRKMETTIIANQQSRKGGVGKIHYRIQPRSLPCSESR